MHQQCAPQVRFVNRRYYSRAERKAWLEEYASQLENELAGVRERIERIDQSGAAPAA